jgi:hypothetical protein
MSALNGGAQIVNIWPGALQGSRRARRRTTGRDTPAYLPKREGHENRRASRSEGVHRARHRPEVATSRGLRRGAPQRLSSHRIIEKRGEGIPAGGHGFGIQKQGTSDHWIDLFYY